MFHSIPARPNDLQLYRDDVHPAPPSNPVDVQPFRVDVHPGVPKTPSMFSLSASIFDSRREWHGLVREAMGARRRDNRPAAKHTLEGGGLPPDRRERVDVQPFRVDVVGDLGV
jgi:hypothetical protein